jgi:pSer/pThr/pTyr-binding forkhead associated (FHA) protein
MARLRLVAESTFVTWQLSDRFTVGRDESNTLCLQEDNAISREHLVIERSLRGFVLMDRGSSNGTFLQRQGRKWRVAGEVLLQQGDVIEVGRTRLVFEDESAGPSSPEEQVDPNITVRGRILPALSERKETD